MLTAMNLKKLLVKNINALRAITPGLSSHQQIARAAALRHHKVSSRAIGTLLQDGNPSPPTLATIDAVAHAFNVPAWMLLTPDFDAKQHTGGALPTPEALEILRAIHDSPALRAILTKPGNQHSDTPYLPQDRDVAPVIAEPPAPYRKPSI